MDILHVSVQTVLVECLVTIGALNLALLLPASCETLESIGLVDAMISPQVVFIAGQVFADLLTMLALDPRRVPMQVLHMARYCISMDELHAN